MDIPDYNEDHVYFTINRSDTNYVNRILEGYEYVGVMTTVNKEGLCVVRTTKDTKELAKEILVSLPIELTIIN